MTRAHCLHPRRLVGLGGVVLALAGVVRDARAQDGGAAGGAGVSSEMRAEYLFRSGEKKFDSGRYAEACADFAESLRLGPKLGTLLNLALCHETVGKPATAWSEYNHAAAWAAQNNQKDRHEFAAQHAQALETKLPRVRLELPRDRAIATVEIDGEPLADSHWYMPVFLDPGEHSISLSAPGKQRGTVKFRVTMSPTEQIVTVPALVDATEPSAPAVDERPNDPDRGRRVAGYVTLATGGVGLVLGLTFGMLAISSRDEADDLCVANRCTSAGADAYGTAQDRATVATVATVIGVGATALGGWLVLTSRAPAASKVKPGVRARADGGVELGVGGTF